jgi:uncharacterized SAM-binding protein YcdF (DUF218 family)
MYFIFSKILLFLTWPISWIVAFVLIALFARKPKLKRRAFIISAVLLLVFTNRGIFELVVKAWDVNSGKLDKNKTYSTAIVLGGFSGEDKHGKGYFNDCSDRILEALRLKASGQVSHILVTGGSGSLNPDGFSEGEFVRGVLKEMKYPDSAILIEPKSRNTIENAAFTKELLQRSGMKPPYILVTSAYHMRRSQYIFQKTGLDVIPYSCNYVAGIGRLSFFDYILPDAGTLNLWGLYIKEMIGLVVTHLKMR